MELSPPESALSQALRDRGTIPLSISRPVEGYLQDASAFHLQADKDRDDLALHGIAGELIDEMGTSISLGRKSTSEWSTKDFSNRDHIKANAVTAQQAKQLRNRLRKAARNAYAGIPELLRHVSAISQGKSHPEVIQDLSDLASLMRANPAELAAINFPLSHIDNAEKTAQDVSALLAQSQSDRTKVNPERVFRDIVLMNIKLISTRIRLAAADAFDATPDRMKGYKAIKTSSKKPRPSKKTPPAVPPKLYSHTDD